MGNIPFFDILILAMIAVFILNRLRNVLGKKTGNNFFSSITYKQSGRTFTTTQRDADNNFKVTTVAPKSLGKLVIIKSKSINNLCYILLLIC